MSPEVFKMHTHLKKLGPICIERSPQWAWDASESDWLCVDANICHNNQYVTEQLFPQLLKATFAYCLNSSFLLEMVSAAKNCIPDKFMTYANILA